MSEILYLSRSDVESLGLPMADVIEALQAAFAAKGNGKVEMPPKPGIHTRPDAFIHAMPCYVSGEDVAGMKWVSGYPGNQGKGLPYISGLLILNDADTGFPLAVMDATWITAVRTGAATAVAARFLADREATVAAILGCGVQGRANVDALICVQPHLQKVLAYDISPAAAEKFKTEIEGRHHLDVHLCRSPQDAVQGAEIVVTAGPILTEPSPVILSDWLQPGTFLCTLDFDSYVTPDCFDSADRLFSDDVHQLDYYRGEGYFSGVPERAEELSDVVLNRVPDTTASDRVITINLGLALSDIVTGQLVYRLAIEQGAGRLLPL